MTPAGSVRFCSAVVQKGTDRNVYEIVDVRLLLRYKMENEGQTRSPLQNSTEFHVPITNENNACHQNRSCQNRRACHRCAARTRELRALNDKEPNKLPIVSRNPGP